MFIRHVIDHSVLLRAMPEGARAAFASVGRVRRFRNGQYIWQFGDPDDCLQVVAEGMVLIGMMSPEGEHLVLHVVARGETMGEPSVYSPERDRRTDARAVGQTTIVEVPGEAVRTALEASPEAMRIFVRRVSDICRGHSRRLALGAFADARGRLARVLLDLADGHGVATPRGRCIELRLSQRTIAGLVSVRRESVNRLLTGLERDGVLLFEDGAITILEERLLRSALGLEASLP